jgi:hypothetical protein
VCIVVVFSSELVLVGRFEHPAVARTEDRRIIDFMMAIVVGLKLDVS